MQDQQERALASLMGMARTKDIVNGYWAGYFDGLVKTFQIPAELLSKPDDE